MPRYELLANDAIRLIDFGNDVLKEPEFLTTPLHGCPSFDAICYTWGSNAELKLIFKISDQNFDLLPNLHGFLEEYKARGCRGRLWADGVCIDQTNLEEKGQEITWSTTARSTPLRGPLSAIVVISYLNYSTTVL